MDSEAKSKVNKQLLGLMDSEAKSEANKQVLAKANKQESRNKRLHSEVSQKEENIGHVIDCSLPVMNGPKEENIGHVIDYSLPVMNGDQEDDQKEEKIGQLPVISGDQEYVDAAEAKWITKKRAARTYAVLNGIHRIDLFSEAK